MTKDSLDKVPFLRHAGLIFAVAASIALLHISAKSILSNSRSTGQFIEMAARDSEQNDYHVTCYENWNSPFADYSYGEMSLIFTDFRMLKGTGLDTTNFVQCNAERSNVTYTAEQINNSVIFLGDSVASGKGVRKSSQFQEVIQKIAVDNNGEPVKTIDLSFEGSNFAFVREKFLTLVKMKPRSIVYVWSPADIPFFSLEPPLAFQNSAHWDQPNYFMSKNGSPEAQLFKGAWTLFQDRRDQKRWITTINSAANRDGMEYLLSSIKSRQAEASALGVDFRVVLFPLLEGRRNHYLYADIHKKMSAFLAANNIPSLDIAPVLFNRNPREIRVNSINLRLNEEAHRRVATAIVPFIGLHSKPTHWDSGSAAKRIRKADLPDDKYAQIEERVFCTVIFYLLIILFFSCVAASALHIPLIMRDLSDSGGKTILLLLFVITYACLLRVYVSPHAHLVLGDEYDRLRIVELWIAGVFGAHTYNIYPGAMAAYYPIYMLFGIHSQVGFYFSVFLSTISCVMMFLVVKSLFKKDGVAIIAAFLLANYPVCLRFSGSLAAEIPNLFFMLLCVYSLVQYRTDRKFNSSLLFFTSLSFFIFIRIHNIVFAAFILYCYISINYRRSYAEDGPRTSMLLTKIVASFVRTRSDIVLVIIFAISLACYVILFYISVTIGDYSRNVKTIAITDHFADNLRFIVSNKYIPIIYVIICCVPIVSLLFNRRTIASSKTVVFMAVWIIIYFICHLQAGSGQYVRSAESVRHTIDFAVPLLILTALGIYMIKSCLPGNIAKNIFSVSMIIFIVLVPLSHMSEIKDKGYVDNSIRAMLTVVGSYPESSLFVTNTLLIHDAVDLNLRAEARIAQSKSDALRICSKRQDCVFVLYKYSQGADFEFIRNLCPDSIHYINIQTAICPFERLNDIPDDRFLPPEFERGGGDYVSNMPYGMNIDMRKGKKTIQP